MLLPSSWQVRLRFAYGLQTFAPPPDAARDYPREVFEYLRSFPVTASPFNYVLRGIWAGRLLSTFEVLDKVDLDYHLRHSALPYPGGERELGILVSRLHSNPMDLDRPLWEMHLIEELHGGRFALYTKLHHSLADGISGVGLLNFADDPAHSRTPPVWAVERERRGRSPVGAGAYGAEHLSSAAKRIERDWGVVDGNPSGLPFPPGDVCSCFGVP